MISPILRAAVAALACAPLLSFANGTAPAAAVSAPPLAAVPAADPVPAPAPITSPVVPPAMSAAAAPDAPSAPVVDGSPVTTFLVGMPPAAPSGWMPWVPVYTVPVWPAHWPLPVPIQPATGPGGVAYVLMWVPVPLGSAAMPAAETAPAPSAALPSVDDVAQSPAPAASTPPSPAEPADAPAPALTVAAPPAPAAASAPAAANSAPLATAAGVGARPAARPATVDYGPVAPTPVVYLLRRARPPAPAVAPARAPASAAAPVAKTRPAPKRRLCWSDGVVAPCR